MVKSASSENLGNIADADLKEWHRSIHAIMKKFHAAKVVVLGCGTRVNSNLFQRTLDLLLAK
jgi:metallo-beta-lactamase class B